MVFAVRSFQTRPKTVQFSYVKHRAWMFSIRGFLLFLHSFRTVGKTNEKNQIVTVLSIMSVEKRRVSHSRHFPYSRLSWMQMNLVYKQNRTFFQLTICTFYYVELEDEWVYLPINVLGSRLGEPLELRFVVATRLLEWFIREVFCCNKVLTLFVPLILELVNSTFDATASETGAPIGLEAWFPADASSKVRLKKLACKALNGSIRRLGSYSSICWTSSLNFT